MTFPWSRGDGKVLPLIAGMVAVGIAVDLTVVNLNGSHLPLSAAVVRLVLLAGVFALCDGAVIHIELGRNAHSVSLGEVALTLGLFFLSPMELPLVRVLAGAAVLLVVRRQRPLKVAFNLAVWVLDVALATATFQALHGGLNAGGARLVIPALAACLVAAAVDSAAVNAAISLTSGELQAAAAIRLVLTCLAGGLVSAMIGLLLVPALGRSLWLAPAIVVGVGTVLLGFHRHGALRQQHHTMMELYEFTDAIAATPYRRFEVGPVLDRVTQLLRSERSALWLPNGADDWQETRWTAGGEHTTHTVPDGEVPEVIRRALNGGEPIVVRSPEKVGGSKGVLGYYGARDVVLAPVHSRQGTPGVLLALDRLGEVATFTAADRRLLQTVATHVGTALANSRLMRKLDYDSNHDTLTGLANRAYFQRRVTDALESERPVAVLLMDLDRFKEVNDTLGHHHGDLLLQQIAGRLRDEVRATDLLARLGGDEFAVLTESASEADAVAAAERLRHALLAPVRIEGVDMEVTSSVGVVLMGSDSFHEPTSQLGAVVALQRADVAMYRAKQDGSGIQVYQEDLADHSPRRLALAGNLRSAVDLGQLSLRYQPQARLTDGVIVGVEALTRWDHPVYGEVPPDEFIGTAEQTGQIRELTRFVIDEALRQCAEWNANGHQLRMSVNLSVRNLLEPDLVDYLQDRLAAYQVPSWLLTLELTESHVMADSSRTPQLLADLALLGTRLSVDDFGTGYSSLAYLRRLPLRELKIDKTFVRDIASNSNDAAIVEAIIQLAHALRIEVVAEGIEDPAAERLLRNLGCDLMQGYHLAQPMRAEQLTGWLADHDTGQRRPVLRALPTPRVESFSAVETS